MPARLAAWIAATLLVTVAMWSSEALAQDFSTVVARVRPAVALIAVERRDGKIATGTGFAVQRSPNLITAAHLVEDARAVAVRYPSGVISTATPVLIWHERDIALLRPERLPPSGLTGRTSPPRQGEPIVVIGYPLAEKLGIAQVTVTQGIISAVTESGLRLNVSVNPGNSGGPVVDVSGAVVGLASGAFPGTGLAVASPWADVARALDAASRGAYVVSVYLDDAPDQGYITAWVEQGLMLVGLRPLSQLLGAALFWNPRDASITLAVGDKRLRFVVGSRQMEVDGRRIQLPAPVKADRSVPLRPVLAALAGSVVVDTTSFTARIRVPGIAATSVAAQPLPATSPAQPSPVPTPSLRPTPFPEPSIPPPIPSPTLPSLPPSPTPAPPLPSPSPTPGIAAVPSPARPDISAPWRIQPGAGIGPVKIGYSREVVEGLLGPPSEMRNEGRWVFAEYRSVGLFVAYVQGGGVVEALIVGTGVFTGVSPAVTEDVLRRLYSVERSGTRLGDSRSDVVQANGRPLDTSVSAENVEILHYQGIGFLVSKGRVMVIVVNR